MKVVVFGASGKVGQKVVAELLSRGHKVRAFIYDNSPFDEHKNIEVVSGNVKDLSSVEQAVKGQDAVISTLGSWGTQTKDILSEGMKNIIPAMKESAVERIVSLTGADARYSKDQVTLIGKLIRPILKMVAPKILSDGEKHIELLENSGLGWTVVRSPVMNERGVTSYRLDNKAALPWQTINRNSVSKAIVDCVEKDLFMRQAPVIFRTK